nr:hypothetical protein Itr_chr04CG09370 [Ipomoea trifida]
MGAILNGRSTLSKSIKFLSTIVLMLFRALLLAMRLSNRWFLSSSELPRSMRFFWSSSVHEIADSVCSCLSLVVSFPSPFSSPPASTSWFSVPSSDS